MFYFIIKNNKIIIYFEPDLSWTNSLFIVFLFKFPVSSNSNLNIVSSFPISSNNIELISKQEDYTEKHIINEHSADADLTIIGFHRELVKHNSTEVFNGYDKIGDILFVNTNTQKTIK